MAQQTDQPRQNPPSDEARKRCKIQKQLDEALADSFPASDPVSIVTSQQEEDWGTEETVPEPPEQKK